MDDDWTEVTVYIDGLTLTRRIPMGRNGNKALYAQSFDNSIIMASNDLHKLLVSRFGDRE